MSGRNKRMDPYLDSPSSLLKAAQTVLDSQSSRHHPQEENLRLARSKKVLMGIILVILVLFSLDVVYQSYCNYQEKFTVSEEQSKACLAQFSKENCQLNNLSQSCQRILDCVQKENKFSSERFNFFVSTFIDEIIENYQLPAIGTGLMLFLMVMYELRIGIEKLHKD